MTAAKRMHGYLLAIGSELVSADRLETNSFEIQGMLFDQGIEVVGCSVVGDDEARIREAMEHAAGQADFVIATGGLGPTEDDLTREAAALAAGAPLEEDPGALASLEAFFTSRGRSLTPSNRRQARIPKGARVLENPIGTAPAFVVAVKGKPLYCLPGVPGEMRRLMEASVLPELKTMSPASGGPGRRIKVKLIGLTESAVNDRIKDLLAAGEPRVGITVSRSVITIILTPGPGKDLESLKPSLEQIRRVFKGHLFHEGGEKRFEDAVGELLIDKGVTLALAESCTGGLIGDLLTDVPGISAVLLEGTVAYSGEAKARTLGVPKTLMEERGQVSAEVAKAMARGAAEHAGARAGLAVTGIAGPGGGTPEKPLGLVHMAAWVDGRFFEREYRFSGDRRMIKERSAYLALDLLRRAVLDLE